MRKLRPTLHWRVHHEGGHGETEFIELHPGELSGLFAAPPWLRDLGVMAWLLVGVTALLAGTVWFLSLTQTIVTPVVTAAILASVLAPLVRWLKGRLRAVGQGRTRLADGRADLLPAQSLAEHVVGPALVEQDERDEDRGDDRYDLERVVPGRGVRRS